jgi:hypothetical protein
VCGGIVIGFSLIEAFANYYTFGVDNDCTNGNIAALRCDARHIKG